MEVMSGILCWVSSLSFFFLLSSIHSPHLHCPSGDRLAAATAAAMAMAAVQDEMAQKERDNTPLHQACANGCVAMVEFLLSQRANKSATTTGGNTPLHIAANKNKVAMACKLLDNGADLFVCNNNGLTPVDVAANHTVVIALFDAQAGNRQSRGIAASSRARWPQEFGPCYGIYWKLGPCRRSYNDDDGDDK
jgi:Ankyrin repeats (many copies)